MIPGKPFKPEDFLTMAARQKWIILGAILLVGGLTAIVTRFLPDQYQSDAMILVVPQRVPESYVQSTVTTDISDRLQTIKEQILSRTALERVIQDFNLYPKVRQTDIMQNIVEAMRRNVRVEIARTNLAKNQRNRDNDSSFRVSFTYSDPRTTMLVTERLASLFIDENLRDRQALAEGTNRFMETQLEDARQRLIGQEKRLATYKMTHNGELPTQSQSNLQVLQNTQMQLQAVQDSMIRDRDRKMMLDRLLQETAAADATAAPVQPLPAGLGRPGDRQPASAADRLEAGRAELRTLELRLKPEHPDIKRMKRTIADLEREANAEALQRPVSQGEAPPRVTTPAEAQRASKFKDQRAEFESIDGEIARKLNEEARLKTKLADYQHRLEAGPAREAELVELMRDHDTLQRSYANLLTKNEESKRSAALERQQIGEQFKVIDPARMPEKPTSPNRPLVNAVGALVGIGLGVAIAAWREYKDSSLRTDGDVLIALALPVLAMVPLMTTTAERRRMKRRRWTMALAAGTALVLALAVVMWKY